MNDLFTIDLTAWPFQGKYNIQVVTPGYPHKRKQRTISKKRARIYRKKTEWHHLRVVANNNHHQIYFDDERLEEAEWDDIVSKPHVRQALRRMAEEAHHGEIEDGFGEDE